MDSGVALRAAAAAPARQRLGVHELRAPGLLWSEVTSALHEAAWRGELDTARARALLRAFVRLPIAQDDPPTLRDVAWEIADEVGLAKTYDAEFLALARIRDCRLVTTDQRLRRGADRLGFVVGPTEL